MTTEQLLATLTDTELSTLELVVLDIAEMSGPNKRELLGKLMDEEERREQERQQCQKQSSVSMK